MDDYAGRVLADRYRLPLPPSDEFDLVETRAFDTYSGQEVLVRQVPLPEVVDAEMVDPDGAAAARRVSGGRTTRRPTDPAVRRAIDAAQSAAQIPDHPRLDQVFDVFAESGSLWIVSELVAARPLAALLAEKPLNPYRAAEIASDVLTAVRVLHAHGWTHRNITIRTVLVCDDGRVVLTGLAAGAAEEALCGYMPVPPTPGEGGFEAGHRPAGEIPGPVPGAARTPGPELGPVTDGPETAGLPGAGPGVVGIPGGRTGTSEALPPGTGALGVPVGPASPGRAALETARSADGPYGDGSYGDGSYGDRSYGEVPYGTDAFGRPVAGRGPDTGGPDTDTEGGQDGPDGPDTRGGTAPAPVVPYTGQPALPANPSRSGPADTRAARAGAIAAYRAGARAAARVTEDQQRDTGTLPVQRPVHLSDPSAPGRSGSPDNPPGGPSAGAAGPSQGEGRDPDWWAMPPREIDPSGHRPYDDRADDDHDTDDDDPHPPRRVQLAGTWHDGPTGAGDGSRPLSAGGGDPYRRSPGGHDAPALPPAGGSSPYLRQADAGGTGGTGGGGTGGGSWHGSGTGDAMRADSRRQSPNLPAVPGPAVPAGRWDEVVAGGTTPAYRGPATPLAAERARQARIAVVGAVTERWAPEQAGPVHENWQLAPPIGPSTDLWALGALLYRAVQGHAPYPEESAAELVQLVCAEPPAFAEECGPLRPVVESLLRQDPTERPDFEELRGWLRSLVRSAPEPDAGLDVVAVPSVDERLPIVRRKGELVRKRRGRRGDGRHRHKKGRERKERGGRSEQRGAPRASHGETYVEPRREHEERAYGQRDHRDEDFGDREYREPRERSGGGGSRGPRSLGRVLLVVILALMVAAIAFAVMFLPKAGEEGSGDGAASNPSAPGTPQPQNPDTTPDSGGDKPGDPDSSKTPQTSGPPADLADGYVLREDAEGFDIGVDKSWQRRPINDSGQVRYGRGDFTLIVVPGRDTVADNGDDPLAYQREKERELQPFRDSSWATSSGLRRIDVGQQPMAEGQFTWQNSSGQEVYVRNLAMIVKDSYHIIQVIGPEDERDKVSEIYQQAIGSYRITG
ncbi:protein kinase [Streptomyces sp. NBC_00838]|uniref:protein kinase n=1 Tax=Streptomyces sp. NBC_00838 TaxID=2903680 RepID=UPI00386F98EE|nr:protein kinase [Streptomyces sp. NBC_00838]